MANDFGKQYERGNDSNSRNIFQAFTKSAQDGPPCAQYSLGVHCEHGGTPADYQEALESYTKGAAGGQLDDQFNLGCCYYFGKGIPVDYQKAVLWFARAAEHGHLDAQNELGVCYEHGRGISVDYEKALELYAKAAEGGHQHAQYNLGICYYFGRGIPVDHQKAVLWFTHAAEGGDLDAQYNLGIWYCSGERIPVDYQKGFMWLTKAAEKGHVNAQYNLGFCYERGWGTPVDFQEAFNWYTKAAECGQITAQLNLGKCYANGEGTSADYQKALEWFTKAAEGGEVNAQYNLGILYYSGRGTAIDYPKAQEWFTKASESGHNAAQFCLGVYYQYGSSKPDYQKAFKWYMIAAESGNTLAQYNLGSCYYFGYGVSVNYQQALEWFKRAAESGQIEANNAVYKLQQQLQNVQVEDDEKINSGYEHIDNLVKSAPFLDWIPYENINFLNKAGKGGFSTIFKAKFNPFKPYHKHEYVAAKCLKNSKEMDDQFLKEAKHYLNMVNPNVIRMHGISRNPETGIFMIIMQWCEDGDLGKNLDHIQTYRDFCKIIQLIAYGLKDIHSGGLCHRDLHIGNILFDRSEYTLYISDLGLCGPVNPEPGKVTGVLPYIAPEVLRGQQYTQAADIYSFGVIIWVLLTHQQPFSGMNWCNKSDLYWNKVEGGGQPEIPKWAPDWVIELILNCWNKDPSMRPLAQNIFDVISEVKLFPYEDFPSPSSSDQSLCSSSSQIYCISSYDVTI